MIYATKLGLNQDTRHILLMMKYKGIYHDDLELLMAWLAHKCRINVDSFSCRSKTLRVHAVALQRAKCQSADTAGWPAGSSHEASWFTPYEHHQSPSGETPALLCMATRGPCCKLPGRKPHFERRWCSEPSSVSNLLQQNGSHGGHQNHPIFCCRMGFPIYNLFHVNPSNPRYIREKTHGRPLWKPLYLS